MPFMSFFTKLSAGRMYAESDIDKYYTFVTCTKTLGGIHPNPMHIHYKLFLHALSV